MFDPREIRSLTEFQRNAKAFVARLQRSGRPEVLTVNGKAAIVVQDAASFARMLQELDAGRAAEAVRVGLEQAEAGKTLALEQARRELRRKHGLGKRGRKSA